MIRGLRHLRAAAVAGACAASIGTFATSPAAHELRPFRAETVEAIRQTHAGNAFVLAFWSIHCEPCRDEMAVWRDVRRRYPDLPILLVSTDVAAERSAVTAFLARYDPGPVETWIFDDEFAERVRFAVDRTWRGELPRTYLYDAAHRAEARSGKLDERWLRGWFAREAKGRPRRP
jgi:thiol-disulfide isomerase/thioredoxin